MLLIFWLRSAAAFVDALTGMMKTVIVMVMGGRDVDVIAAGKAMNEALDGRGGGSKEMFQGSLKAAREQIEKYFANL